MHPIILPESVPLPAMIVIVLVTIMALVLFVRDYFRNGRF